LEKKKPYGKEKLQEILREVKKFIPSATMRGEL